MGIYRGPHTAGAGEPYAAWILPTRHGGGCNPADESVIAMADGVIARLTPLSYLGSGWRREERTGWVIYYLHIAGNGGSSRSEGKSRRPDWLSVLRGAMQPYACAHCPQIQR